jgi:hypothetical protein
VLNDQFELGHQTSPGSYRPYALAIDGSAQTR